MSQKVKTNKILSKIIKITQKYIQDECLCKNKPSLTLDTDLYKDLQFDILDTVQFYLLLEKSFSILQISDTEQKNIKTIKDVYDVVYQKIIETRQKHNISTAYISGITKEQILDDIMNILTKDLGIQINLINLKTSLTKDLDLDISDIIYLAYRLETKYYLKQMNITNIKTIDDLCSLVIFNIKQNNSIFINTHLGLSR